MVNDWAKERCFKKNLKEKGGKKVYVQCRNFRAKLQADEDINGAIKKCGCDGVRKEYVYFCTPILNFAS